MNDTFLSKKLKFDRFKSVIGVFLVIVGILISLLVLGANIFSDNFEAYNLGNLGGQGNWIPHPNVPAHQWEVENWFSFSGEKAIKSKIYPQATNFNRVAPELGLTSGVISFWFYGTTEIIDNPEMGLALRAYDPIEDNLSAAKANIIIKKVGDVYYLQIQELVEPPYAWFNVGIVSLEEWHFLSMKFDFNTRKYSVKLDNEPRSADYGTWTLEPWISINNVQFGCGEWICYVDDISDEEAIIIEPEEPEIKGILPESGTEITDLNTTITIEYSGFDWEIYNGFVVNFRDNKIWAVANSIQFLKEDLDPSGNGEKIINLQDFGIDSNGIWYLTGLGFGTHLDIEGGMFLTTRGYIDFYTDELVLDPYYLLFNVEGLPIPYSFISCEDWYSVHIERFATPTTFFCAFVNLIAPVFERVSEFSLRVQPMFDKNQSYERGYSWGEVFPLVIGYTKKIDKFFGGFPLVSAFIYAILVMIAIFIIRMILKFVPFIGGGG